MTKKDYILIAQTLKEVFDENAYCLDTDSDKLSVVQYFIRSLKNENGKFDSVKFAKACGLN